MMRSRAIVVCLVAAVWAVAMPGCVRPGDVDPAVLARYQRALAARGPRARVAADGLMSLKPSAGTTGPAATVVQAGEDGRTSVQITLDQVVMWTLANNPDVAVVAFDPSISRQDMVAAAAAFDATVFAEYTKTYSDRRPGGGALSSFRPTRVATNASEVGIRQTTITGAQWSITGDLTRTWDDSGLAGFRESHEPILDVQITQPLLRDGWLDFNLATLRIARINQKISAEQFRQVVEEAVAQAVSAYWQLHQARRTVEIQKKLVDATDQTLQKVKARMDYDATTVQRAQLESALESRRATLIRAAKGVLDAEQLLQRLVGHEQANVLSTHELVPVTQPVVKPVKIETADQLVTALRHSPQMAQARLAMATSDISVDVARNQKLPVLNFTAGATMQGHGHTLNFAKEQFNSSDYIGYNIGLAFEYPLGNRERLADLRKARLERMKAAATVQQTADAVAVNVAERIREIQTSYQELRAQQKALKAAMEHLQALEDSEIRARLTPEYLNVKLQAQASAASSALAVLQATVAYNVAIVELAQQTGTVLESHRVKLAVPQILQDLRK